MIHQRYFEVAKLYALRKIEGSQGCCRQHMIFTKKNWDFIVAQEQKLSSTPSHGAQGAAIKLQWCARAINLSHTCITSQIKLKWVDVTYTSYWVEAGGFLKVSLPSGPVVKRCEKNYLQSPRRSVIKAKITDNIVNELNNEIGDIRIANC